MGGKTRQPISNPGDQAKAAKQATAKSPASTAGSKKGNAQRARKRAAARKVRKNKLLTLLLWHDKAVKDGKKQTASKIFAKFQADQLVRSEVDEMRTVVSELNKASRAVDMAKQNLAEALPKSRASSEKKLNDAQQRLKKVQTAEQAFFAALTKKQAKNGICPFCQIKRISVDSHVMDMHPPRWGEYLTLLGKLK